MDFHTLNESHFDDPDMRADYVRLREALTRIPGKGDEGAVEATLRQMADDEAVELAKLICDLNSRAKYLREQKYPR